MQFIIQPNHIKNLQYLNHNLTKKNFKKLPRNIDCIVHLAGKRDTFQRG